MFKSTLFILIFISSLEGSIFHNTSTSERLAKRQVLYPSLIDSTSNQILSNPYILYPSTALLPVTYSLTQPLWIQYYLPVYYQLFYPQYQQYQTQYVQSGYPTPPPVYPTPPPAYPMPPPPPPPKVEPVRPPPVMLRSMAADRAPMVDPLEQTIPTTTIAPEAQEEIVEITVTDEAIIETESSSIVPVTVPQLPQPPVGFAADMEVPRVALGSRMLEPPPEATSVADTTIGTTTTTSTTMTPSTTARTTFTTTETSRATTTTLSTATTTTSTTITTMKPATTTRITTPVNSFKPIETHVASFRISAPVPNPPKTMTTTRTSVNQVMLTTTILTTTIAPLTKKDFWSDLNANNTEVRSFEDIKAISERNFERMRNFNPQNRTIKPEKVKKRIDWLKKRGNWTQSGPEVFDHISDFVDNMEIPDMDDLKSVEEHITVTKKP